MSLRVSNKCSATNKNGQPCSISTNSSLCNVHRPKMNRCMAHSISTDMPCNASVIRGTSLCVFHARKILGEDWREDTKKREATEQQCLVSSCANKRDSHFLTCDEHNQVTFL